MSVLTKSDAEASSLRFFFVTHLFMLAFLASLQPVKRVACAKVMRLSIFSKSNRRIFRKPKPKEDFSFLPEFLSKVVEFLELFDRKLEIFP